ncbi:MAG: hypothetical protein L6R42_003307 [Xanthoria sp. 1 TBL-2021]|nr:MAG: hypothetical protein L6R42_003307 [Xanthoria sp. 1 TBL-2021]
MSITFGSVGDIVSVCMLIKGLVKCLDDSRGSSTEYQAVIREIHSLDHALLEVALVTLSNQGSREMSSLKSTVLSIAAQCEKSVTAYREKATQISDENQQRCFKRIKQDQDQSLATQQAMLDEIKIRLDKNSSEVKSARIDVQTIASAIITLQSQLPRQLERTWTQSPVILKDPLGRTTPVHLEFIETFEIFQTVLEMRFDQLPGHRKVQRKEYALSTEQSEQEIDSALAFRRWFRPGQEVDMSQMKRKHQDDPEDEDEPRHFCRVRLIGYRNRTGKEVLEQLFKTAMERSDIPGPRDPIFRDRNSNLRLEHFDFKSFADIMLPSPLSCGPAEDIVRQLM